jgi:hypothetical protein
MYFTDRGIEELQKRRGDEEVTLAWVADQLQAFVDVHPEFEVPVERLATGSRAVTTPTTTERKPAAPRQPCR